MVHGFLNLALAAAAASISGMQPTPAHDQSIACAAADEALKYVAHYAPPDWELGESENLVRVQALLAIVAREELMRSYGPENTGEFRGWEMEASDGGATGVAPPHPETVEAFLAARTTDAIQACPSLKETATVLGGARSVGFLPSKRRTWVSILRPVVSPHGEAIVWADQLSAPLAGGSFLILLRKTPAGAWQAVGRFNIAVS